MGRNSDSLKKATIAVEDKDFYKHQGFDPLTPFRIIKNVFYFKKTHWRVDFNATIS